MYKITKEIYRVDQLCKNKLPFSHFVHRIDDPFEFVFGSVARLGALRSRKHLATWC